MQKTMKREREGLKKGIYILPNLFTTANLFCGFFAVIRAINGDYWMASWAIMFAGIFDFLDGQIARLTHTQSEFGIAYDSLVDLASFGLAPAVLIYTWSLHDFNRFGWIAAFVFFACAALRLARFNVQAGNVERKHFQGLPTPGSAYCLASFVVLYQHLIGPQPKENYFVPILTIVLGILMVSNIPYWSAKSIDRNKRGTFFLLVLITAVSLIIAAAPQVMIFVLAIAYVGVGLIFEILRSPRKIRSFADVVRHYFNAGSDKLVYDDPESEEVTDAGLRILSNDSKETAHKRNRAGEE